MSEMAHERVTAYLLHNRDLYVFGTEQACQRLLHYFQKKTYPVKLHITSDPWYQHYITVPDFG